MTDKVVLWRFLAVLFLRWLPVGVIAPVFVLAMQERGLSLAEIGSVVAVQGITVFVLELPTGGLADAIGRRPVLVLAAAFRVASLALFLIAGSGALFAIVWLLGSISRSRSSWSSSRRDPSAARRLRQGYARSPLWWPGLSG